MPINFDAPLFMQSSPVCAIVAAVARRNVVPILIEGLKRLEGTVVHNGIIENHDEVRALLRGQGHEFSSDTEVIAHLVHSKLKTGLSLLDAVRQSVSELAGAYAIAVIAADDPSRLVVARMGAPARSRATGWK
jgi:glucosamine 6-phosphate synthetase-like amidotransferase/phosphosugar isomerase protein